MGDYHYDAGNYKWNRRAKLIEDLIPEFGVDRKIQIWMDLLLRRKISEAMNEFMLP